MDTLPKNSSLIKIIPGGRKRNIDIFLNKKIKIFLDIEERYLDPYKFFLSVIGLS